MSGNLFTAAYEGMMLAVKHINEDRENGIVRCQLCGVALPPDDPCYKANGWCVDCDEDI